MNIVPTILGLNGDASGFNDVFGGPIPIEIGGDVTVSDPDDTDFDGGSLTVSIANAEAEDQLSIANGGGSGIGLIGSTVYFNGLPFGSASGGSNGAELIVDLAGADADADAVAALIEALRYDNAAGGNPTESTRAIDVVLNDGSGDSAPSRATIAVTNIDDPPVAVDDAVAAMANAVLAGDVTAANPSSPDTDPDDPLAVTAVADGAGATGAVGAVLTLPSGARVTVNADGTFAYDPNGAFDSLPGPLSGASNLTGADGFSYELNGDGTFGSGSGSEADVTVTVAGVDGPGDVLLGTPGADALNGGVGGDTMLGGDGDDRYTVDDPGDAVTEAFTTSGGFDSVQSAAITLNLAASGFSGQAIEAVTLRGAGDLNAIGNILRNVLTGNDGSNVLNGQAGADRMRGLDGNDTYVVDDPGDVVDEGLAGSGGLDRILSSVSIDLLDATRVIGEIERVELTGSADIDVVGNALDNGLVGNAGDNRIAGGAGSDVLTGGLGEDAFYFGENPGNSFVNRITDFSRTDDIIELDDDAFTGFRGGPGLTSEKFLVLGTRAQDGNDVVLYDANTGAVYFDRDGAGGFAPQLFLVVEGAPPLDHTDFLVVA